MRIFVAVNLPEAIKLQIKDFQDLVKQQLHKFNITWVKPEIFHITVKFIGEIDTERFRVAEEVLIEQTGKLKGREIKLRIKELDILPSRQKPRVLSLKVLNGSALKFTDIQKNLHNALVNKGFELSNQLKSPHITLGRIKDRGARINLDKLQFSESSFMVTSIDLMSSELTGQGPIYKILSSFKI